MDLSSKIIGRLKITQYPLKIIHLTPQIIVLENKYPSFHFGELSLIHSSYPSPSPPPNHSLSISILVFINKLYNSLSQFKRKSQSHERLTRVIVRYSWLSAVTGSVDAHGMPGTIQPHALTWEKNMHDCLVIAIISHHHRTSVVWPKARESRI